jgi:hypothetical protein
MTVHGPGAIPLRPQSPNEPSSVPDPESPCVPRPGSVAILLMGTAGLTAFVTTRQAPLAVPWSVRLAIFGLAAMAFWLGLVATLGERDASLQETPRTLIGRLSSSLAHGARRAQLGALPLALLPSTLLLSPAHAVWVVPALFVASALGLCLSEVRASRPGPGRTLLLPGLGRSEAATSRVGGWEIGGLLFCLCATGWYFVVAWHSEGSADNDAAYYFGVARHIVNTGRFEEPLVWHFLAPPASVQHSPFDYWQGLTSIVLLPTMALFGPSSRVALLTMAAVAGASLLLLWYLVAIAAPMRHRLAQAVALVTFAASPSLKYFRFDTETVPVFHVALLLALVALARGRVLLAACAAFCLYLTRGDGIVLCCLIWGACCFALRSSQGTIPIRRALWLLGTIGLLLASHAALCMVLYGVPVPPGARAGARLAHYLDLYRWGSAPSPLPWAARFHASTLAPRVWMAWDNLRTIPFVPQQALFAGLSLLLGWRGARWSLTGLVWFLLFVGSGLVAIAAGILFSPARTLYTMAPLAVLLVAAAIDQLLGHLERWQRHSPRPRVLLLLLMAAVLALVGLPLSGLRPYDLRPRGFPGLEDNLRQLQPFLGGGVVASMHPFSVIAVTDSPAVMIPAGDGRMIEQAFQRYRVRWLVLSSTPCLENAEVICNDILRAKTRSLGHLNFVRVKSSADLTLFRVDDAPAKDGGRGKRRAR